MPLPEVFRRYCTTPEFWSDFVYGKFNELSRPDLDAEPVEMAFAPTATLRVLFQLDGSETTIQVRQPCGNEWRRVVTNMDDGHAMPHAFRWQEADLIGRAAALNDPEIPHPGIPFLLLQPFVVRLARADHDVAYPLTAAAWQSLGAFSERHIRMMARGEPYHLTGSRWQHHHPEGWVVTRGIDQPSERIFRDNIPTVYSLRYPGSGSFPFAEWNTFMAAVEEISAGYVLPDQFPARQDAFALCAGLLASGDLVAAAILADLVEECGLTNPTVLAALRSYEPVRVAWVLEVLLGAPHGEFIRQLCPAAEPPPGPTQRLWLDIAEEGMAHVQGQLIPTLREYGLATGDFIGGSSLGDLVPGTIPPITEAYWFTLRGDLAETITVIRNTMRNRPGNYPAYLHIVDPTITDGPALRPITLE